MSDEIDESGRHANAVQQHRPRPARDETKVVDRPSTTFKPRRRSLSAKRQAEFELWLQRWGIEETGPELVWHEVFSDLVDSGLPVVLDIGFGRGEATIDMGRADANRAIVGLEVHTPGAVAVLDAIENDPLPHVRVVHGDALRFLMRVPAASLSEVRIYFPDPWTKKRQHQRRLVRADVVSALVDRLEPDGVLHLATDIEDYAIEMQEVCDAEPRLSGGVIERPDWRPLTRFEQRGLDEGRMPTDLLYVHTPTEHTTREANGPTSG